MQVVIAIQKLTKCCQKCCNLLRIWSKTRPNARTRAINNNFWRLFWILLWHFPSILALNVPRFCKDMNVWVWVCGTNAARNARRYFFFFFFVLWWLWRAGTNLGHLQRLANYLFCCHCAFSRQLNIFHCIQMGARGAWYSHSATHTRTKSCIVK